MIKQENIVTGKSYFKPDTERIYDLTRNNIYRLKIFGITIYERSDIITDSEIVNINSEKKIGFNDK